MHFPKVTFGDKKNFYTKFFFVAQFFNVPRATGTPRTCKRNGHIINFFCGTIPRDTGILEARTKNGHIIFFKYNRVTPQRKDNLM